jgi:hypothetical protein
MKRYFIAAAVLLAVTSCDKDKSGDSKYKQEVSPVVDTELMNPGATDGQAPAKAARKARYTRIRSY